MLFFTHRKHMLSLLEIILIMVEVKINKFQIKKKKKDQNLLDFQQKL